MADVIEQGRRSRRWVGTAVLAILIGVPLVALFLTRGDDRPPAAAATPTPAPSSPPVTPRRWSPVNDLFPAEKITVYTAAIRVTFPDGSRADISYPRDLALAGLGVRPAARGYLKGAEGELFDLMAPRGGEAEIARSGQKIRPLASGVTLWSTLTGPIRGAVVLFEFPPWKLALYDRHNALTFDERLAWAEGLHGRVTRDGFLVLSASGKVRLMPAGAERDGLPLGPELWFGEGDRLVIVAPMPHCDGGVHTPAAIDGLTRVSDRTCKGDFLLAATGPRDWLDRVMKDVRIRPVKGIMK